MVRIVALLAVLLVVASCGITPPEGATCFVDTYTRHDGDLRPIRMMATSNNRWCSFTWQMEYGAAPQPLIGGRVVTAPTAGKARVLDAGGKTWVEYLAPLAYVGPDAFTVELGQQKMVLRVEVDVRAPPSTASSPTPSITAATQPPVAPASAVPGLQPLTEPIGFRCPPQKTVQTFSDGGSIMWLGTAPGSPDICIGRNRAGAPVERVRGIWNIGTVWPDAIPAVRTAMAKLTTDPPGADVPFTVTGQTSQHDDPRPGTWTHSVRVLGADDLAMQGGSFSTVLIEDIQTSPTTGAYLARDLLWVDRTSGVVVKSELDQANPAKHTTWETTSLKPPP
jgi:hypothetical protein